MDEGSVIQHLNKSNATGCSPRHPVSTERQLNTTTSKLEGCLELT